MSASLRAAKRQNTKNKEYESWGLSGPDFFWSKLESTPDFLTPIRSPVKKPRAVAVSLQKYSQRHILHMRDMRRANTRATVSECGREFTVRSRRSLYAECVFTKGAKCLLADSQQSGVFQRFRDVLGHIYIPIHRGLTVFNSTSLKQSFSGSVLHDRLCTEYQLWIMQREAAQTSRVFLGQ